MGPVAHLDIGLDSAHLGVLEELLENISCRFKQLSSCQELVILVDGVPSCDKEPDYQVYEERVFSRIMVYVVVQVHGVVQLIISVAPELRIINIFVLP